MTRAERVLVLVWSLPDALPAPGSWTGSLTRGQPRRADAGDPYVVSVGAEPEGSGPVVHVEGCEWCQAGPRARWDEQRGTWVPLVSRYDCLPRGTGVRAGRRCVPCDGSGWRPVSSSANGSKPRAELVAYRLPGPYALLERRLVELRAVSPRAVKRLFEVAFRDEPEGDWSRLAVAFLSERLPARIHLAPGLVESWRARDERRWRVATPRRNQQIRRLAAEGEPVLRIAARTRLSERQVRRIIAGR